MDVGAALMAGLTGTAVVVIFYSLAPVVGVPRLDATRLLGLLLFEPGSRAARWGLFMHFTVGVVFALVYTLLWESGVGRVDYVWGGVFGAVHGVIAAIVVPPLLQRHPRLERGDIPSLPGLAISLILTHAVFGVVVALQYGALR